MQFCCTSLDNNEVFLALDYCKGVALSHLIDRYKERSVPAKLLHKIMLESTLAVQHCLSHGIVHCDIKPSNVVFASMDRPLKLIDFGCAVNLGEGIDPKRDIAGTWEYMAPEILLQGLRALDHKSDVYSLAAMFSKVITRRTPWSHHEQIRAAWSDRQRKGEIKDIIRKELNECSDGQTALQSILTTSSSAHFSRMPEQCKLISRMLSFHHSNRPSCEDILDNIPTVFKKSKRNEATDDAAEPEETAYIPALVFSCNTTNSKDQRGTTSVTSAAYEDSMTGEQLTTGNTTEPVESSFFFGPASGASLIAEDVREDYDEALWDQDQMIAELMRQHIMQADNWDLMNVYDEEDDEDDLYNHYDFAEEAESFMVVDEPESSDDE